MPGLQRPGSFGMVRAPLLSRRGEEPWAREASGTSDSNKTECRSVIDKDGFDPDYVSRSKS